LAGFSFRVKVNFVTPRRRCRNCSPVSPESCTDIPRLADYCIPVSDVAAAPARLRSASSHRLTVPSVRCSNFGCSSFPSGGWSYSLEFTARQSAQSGCWARPVSTESENSPVCLLLAFRCQCVGGVFLSIRAIQSTFTYLLAYLLWSAVCLFIYFSFFSRHTFSDVGKPTSPKRSHTT